MIRVHIICEGQTEETFVTEVLQWHFNPKAIYLYPSLVGEPGKQGGGITYARLYPDLRERLKNDEKSYCTTFFDAYALPSDFPGKSSADAVSDIYHKAKLIQDGLQERLKADLGEHALQRFIPYVQMFEFEALLFSDPRGLANGIDQPQFAQDFQNIRRQFTTPEDINDHPDTAPSKRIISFVSHYEKPTYGVLAAIEIGLDIMRRECYLFNAWLERLESLRPLA